MIAFTVTIVNMGVDNVVLTLKADGESIGHLVLSARMCRAIVSRLFGDEEKGDNHVILGTDD